MQHRQRPQHDHPRLAAATRETTLLIAVALVMLVVFLFLRNGRATLIPAVAVPVSIIGTFGAMYLLGYSLDNLSLMALTVATGFVVDDAIVVLENITRHIEAGMPRVQAALLGAREVGFTVLSISLSLIAVFMPILLMGGIVGRLFREFARDAVAGDPGVAGDLADHHADDVRAVPAAGQPRGRHAASQRLFDRALRPLRAQRWLGAAPRRAGDAGAADRPSR